MNEELKPCPFCDGKIKLDEDDFYMFCCDKCGAGITLAKEVILFLIYQVTKLRYMMAN